MSGALLGQAVGGGISSAIFTAIVGFISRSLRSWIEPGLANKGSQQSVED